MSKSPRPRRPLPSDWGRDFVAQCAQHALAHCGPWEGVGFRATSPRWADPENMVTGSGSALHGGRWNKPGQRTVYASLDPFAAMREAYRQRATFGFDPTRCTTLVVRPIRFRLPRVADLRTSSLPSDLRDAMEAALRQDRDRPPILSQELGQAIEGLGVCAILVPSLVDRAATNIAVFRAACGPGCVIEPVGDQAD